MQGHTDRFAFGRTNFHIDQDDLFVLELHPTDPERYRHDGGWKRFTTVDVEIPVKDAAPRTVRLRSGCGFVGAARLLDATLRLQEAPGSQPALRA